MILIHVLPAVFFFTLAFFVALHHYFIHRDTYCDKARDESCAVCCYLQPSDMRNHEIWVVSSVCVGLTWLIAGFVLMHEQ